MGKELKVVLEENSALKKQNELTYVMLDPDQKREVDMITGELKKLDPEWHGKTRYDMQGVIEEKAEYI